MSDQYAEAREVIAHAKADARRELNQIAEHFPNGMTARTWERISEALARCYVAGYQHCARDAVAMIEPMKRGASIRETPAAYQSEYEIPAAYDLSHRLATAAPPSPLEALRAARPSRELLGLLARECVKAAEAGNINDASALLILGLCVREVIS